MYMLIYFLRSFFSYWQKYYSAQQLLCNDVGCRRSFWIVFYIKGERRTFFEGSETICNDGRVVNKHIITVILCYKTKTFCIVKPFYCSCGHLKVV